MTFLCLAYGAEAGWKRLSEDEQQALLAQDEVIRRRGALMAAVEPGVVTTVRAWDGVPSIEHRPLVSSTIPFAGFSVIEAENLEEVIRLVANTPCGRARGAIEIRPLLAINAPR